MRYRIIKYLIVIAIFTTTKLYSQVLELPPNANFYDYLNAFYNSPRNDPNDTTEGGDVAQNRRLEFVWGQRLHPHGNFSIANNAILDYATNYSDVDIITDNANWICIGPSGNPNYSSNTKGVGQIHRITFDPGYGINNQTVYACSGFGGLWRSQDDGMHWTNANTDQLPIAGVADLAVNYNDNNMLFIATGLPDGGVDIIYEPNTANVNPIFTLGVYRSLDFGNTWSPINGGQMLNFINKGGVIRKIEIDKNNPNVLFSATSDGVYRTQNATSPNPYWTKVLGNGDFRNIKFKPGNSNVLYASSDNIYISSNSGTTWSSMTGQGTGLDFNSFVDFVPFRINITTSQAAPDFVYAYIYGYTNNNKKRVYIYYYNGNQWNQIHVYSPTSDLSLSKSWIAIAASNTNPYSIFFYTGAVYGTSNFLTSPIIKYGNYIGDGIYADNHVLEFQPNTQSNPKLFMGHHGGISVGNMISPNNWEFRNTGLQNMLHWSFDDSEFEKDIIITANQDCFNYIFDNEWKAIYGGGDSYIGRSSKVNSDLFFLSNSHANLFSYIKSTNTITIEGGNIPFDGLYITNRTFVSKTGQVKSMPNNNYDYFTFSEVYKRIFDYSLNYNATNLWEINSDLGKHIEDIWKRQITELDYCQANPDVIYLATVGAYSSNGGGYEPSLFKTETGGNNGNYYGIDSYEKISYPGMGSDEFPIISGIAVHPNDPNKVWISMIGYDNIQTRVAYTTNGGLTWSNADPTNSLPKLPVNNIVYQYGSDDALYIATDVGVFYKTASMNHWERYGRFPHVRVTELKINYCQGKLRAATFGRSIWEADLLPMESIIGYTIGYGETLTWEKQKALQTSIKIQNGGKLIVKNLVSMPINAKIVVEPGGQLIVDGGTITNACGDFWQGIVVIGQQNQPQTLPYQGAVRLMNGATIENAVYGIQLYDRQSDGEPIATSAGGLLLASDATFKNNKKAIVAGYYNQSGSYVQNCDFIIDAEYYEKSSSQPFFADLHELNAFNFNGNLFKNEVTDASVSTALLPIGIRAYNTGLQIKNNNIFENLLYGIKSTALNFTNITEINGNTFTKNLTGIYMSGLNAPQIFSNSFETIPFNAALPIAQTFTGVYLDGVQGHSVEENTFFSNLSGIPDKQHPCIGLVVNNGGTQDVEVYLNSFEYLDFAILAQNNNRSSDGLHGLCVKCNEFNYNGSDVSVTAGPLIPASLAGIAINQGSGAADDNAPAGNLFSQLNSNLQWQFNNLSGVNQQIAYWHHNYSIEPRLVPDPQKINNILPVPNLYANYLNACQSKLINGGGGAGKSQTTSLLNNSQSEVESAQTTLATLTDAGNTTALQTEVNTSTPDESYELRNELLDVAPYTSKEVLIDATEKENVLNNAFIRDVLVANPQAAKSEEVLEAIENRSNAMPQYMKDQIASGANLVSEKEALEAKSFYFRTAYTNALNDLLYIYLSDTTLSNPLDSVIYLLESANYLYAKYQLAHIYLSLNDLNKMNTTLAAIAGNYGLKDELITEYEQVSAYFAMMVNIKNANRSIYELTESEIAELTYWYENETNLAASLALNILRQNMLIDYQEPYILPDDELKSSSVQILESGKNNLSSTEILNVYPNPANDYLVCEYQLDNSVEKASISIVQSGSAKAVFSTTLQSNQDALVIDLADFKQGNYIVMLLADGKSVATVSVNIIK